MTPTPTSQETAMDSKPVAWVRRDHLEKARTQAFLCAVSPESLAGTVPLYAAPPSDAAMTAESDTALLRQCLEALEYHQEQTRPIERTDATLAKLRERLS